MKELSTEEKAKRYDEAIEKAEKWHNAPNVDKIPTFGNRIIKDIFPELYESEDETIRGELINFFTNIENGGWCLSSFETRKSWIAWLEKQSNKSHGKSVLESIKEEKIDNTDNVEPKFKVGDWITDRNSVLHITSMDSGFYQFEDSYDVKAIIDKKYHLWTIEDAKDGDVLCIYECDEPKIVFIFKGILKKHCALSYHCYYNIMYPYFSGSEKGCLVSNNEDVKPATKEQHELLLQKMKETGYEWDVEKKELKKIEQTIEIPFGTKDSELQEATYYIPNGYHADVNGNELIIKKGEQKSSWSEEDEKKRTLLIRILEVNHPNGYFKVNPANTSNMEAIHTEELISWLKSLRPQNRWTPSEKQGEQEEPQVYKTKNGEVITYSESKGYKKVVEPKSKAVKELKGE